MTTDAFTEAEADKIKREVRKAEADYRMVYPVPARLAPNLDLAVRAVRALVSAENRAAHLAAQEPTDAEVEAALTALLISESIALGQTADEAADYAIRELETRDLTNLRTGVRCALRYARAARRDEEKR